MFLCVFTSAVNLASWNSPLFFKMWNEHLIVPRRLAVPAVNAYHALLLFSIFQAVEVSGQRLSKVQSADDGDLWEWTLPEVPQGSPGEMKHTMRWLNATCYIAHSQHLFSDANIQLTAQFVFNITFPWVMCLLTSENVFVTVVLYHQTYIIALSNSSPHLSCFCSTYFCLDL